MQKRLYFQKIILFIIQLLIKNFIINLIYLIKYALQQNRKLVYCFIEMKQALNKVEHYAHFKNHS